MTTEQTIEEIRNRLNATTLYKKNTNNTGKDLYYNPVIPLYTVITYTGSSVELVELPPLEFTEYQPDKAKPNLTLPLKDFIEWLLATEKQCKKFDNLREEATK